MAYIKKAWHLSSVLRFNGLSTVLRLCALLTTLPGYKLKKKSGPLVWAFNPDKGPCIKIQYTPYTCAKGPGIPPVKLWAM